MAKPRIRVGLLESTTFLVGAMPVPKYKDWEKTEFATDWDSGQPLYLVTVFLMEEERAEALTIEVPKGGLPNGLMPGVTVRPVELFASPWARVNDRGQLGQGISFRADSLEVGQPLTVAAPEKKAAA
ncbi:hypothetical protein [Streptomyces sp. NPDC008141]|uniref:hypothetical protein n=1 Tax=Streptomyces sp. NPDC008141 TaxID=3364815 RepID=UPI0036DFC1D6